MLSIQYAVVIFNHLSTEYYSFASSHFQNIYFIEPLLVRYVTKRLEGREEDVFVRFWRGRRAVRLSLSQASVYNYVTPKFDERRNLFLTILQPPHLCTSEHFIFLFVCGRRNILRLVPIYSFQKTRLE